MLDEFLCGVIDSMVQCSENMSVPAFMAVPTLASVLVLVFVSIYATYYFRKLGGRRWPLVVWAVCGIAGVFLGINMSLLTYILVTFFVTSTAAKLGGLVIMVALSLVYMVYSLYCQYKL